MSTERVVANLNRALHAVLAKDPDVFFLGEDINDPYGGAFKVARGLSTAFPNRALTTPISEGAIIGIGGGLAIAGGKAIVEVMFGDFIALGFDQLLNFASKSVSMYGSRLPMNLVVRCPTGGNRGYGATHSQCLQKHFVGIPNLSLFEVSPLHDNVPLLEELVNLGHPSILFEDKVLYAQRVLGTDIEDELLTATALPSENRFVHVTSKHFRKPSAVLVCHGGMAIKCIDAARELFLEDEIEVEVLVPSRLYPIRLEEQIATIFGRVDYVFTVEESAAGGTWGAEVAHHVHQVGWGRMKRPVIPLSSRCEIIPAAPHLEKKVLLQKEDIMAAVRSAHR
jgi:pyruvate/2-oxoglutarate/acetoin dehydrogenase E1 component